MSMRLIPGDSLAERIARNGPLPPAEALAVLSDIGEAIDFAHARGTVHRDVKPANILLDPEGASYLSDFGLVRLDDMPGLTRRGDWLGTAEYVSPSRWRVSPTLVHPTLAVVASRRSRTAALRAREPSAALPPTSANLGLTRCHRAGARRPWTGAARGSERAARKTESAQESSTSCAARSARPPAPGGVAVGAGAADPDVGSPASTRRRRTRRGGRRRIRPVPELVNQPWARGGGIATKRR
jgi:hypothetical protein